MLHGCRKSQTNLSGVGGLLVVMSRRLAWSHSVVVIPLEWFGRGLRWALVF